MILGLGTGSTVDYALRKIGKMVNEGIKIKGIPTSFRTKKIANEKKCNLFIVAGDLFDRKTVSKADILKAAQILGHFNGNLVAVLPGNHDYISRGHTDNWSTFKDNSSDRMLLLEKESVYELEHYDLNVNLYPAPCDSKHSDTNRIDWILKTSINRDNKFHIGIAHGTLEGLAADVEGIYYPMTRTELSRCHLDLWMLGHIHTPFPIKAGDKNSIFYPGTPEPDGFDCRHEGKAWFIEIDEDKQIHADLQLVGKYQFTKCSEKINSLKDLEKFLENYTTKDYSNHLIKLSLKGRLSKENYEQIPDIIKNVENKALYLNVVNDINEEITLNIINSEFTQESFPHQLLTQLEKERDLEALQIAYDIIRRVKQ